MRCHQEKRGCAACAGGERALARWRGAGERLTVRGVLDVVIELAVAPHLSEEQGNGGHADPGEGAQRIDNLPMHLVLQGAAVEEEGSGGEGVPGAKQRPESPDALAPHEAGRASVSAAGQPLALALCCDIRAMVWGTACRPFGKSCARGRARLALGVRSNALCQWYLFLVRDD